MHLDQDVFGGLRGDWVFGIDFGPVENAGQVVELASGGEKVGFGQRLFRI